MFSAKRTDCYFLHCAKSNQKARARTCKKLPVASFCASETAETGRIANGREQGDHVSRRSRAAALWTPRERFKSPLDTWLFLNTAKLQLPTAPKLTCSHKFHPRNPTVSLQQNNPLSKLRSLAFARRHPFRTDSNPHRRYPETLRFPTRPVT